jgi:hypothetical protein
MYSFPFVNVKDKLPASTAIGDGWTSFESAYDSNTDFGDEDEYQTPTSS